MWNSAADGWHESTREGLFFLVHVSDLFSLYYANIDVIFYFAFFWENKLCNVFHPLGVDTTG